MVNVGKYTIHGSLGIHGFLSAFFPASCSDSMLNVLVLRSPEVQAQQHPNDIDYSNLTVLVLKQNDHEIVRGVFPEVFGTCVGTCFFLKQFVHLRIIFVLPILGCFTMFGFPMTPVCFFTFCKTSPG